MFLDLPKAPVFDASRWQASLKQRLEALLARPRRIAWLYENIDTSTFRYRAINMINALEADSEREVSASWFGPEDLPYVQAILGKIDTLVIARFRYTPELHCLVERARQLGVKVLFDSDDLVFDVDYAALVADTSAQDITASSTWDYWFAYMGRLNATARLCDGGITTNPYLAVRMKKTMNGKPVCVIPNFLHRQQQTYSSLLLERKRENGWLRSGPITIGYFSGSPSHRRDFAVAGPALERLLDSNSTVNVRIVGYLDETGPLQRFKDRIEVFPFMDFIGLQRVISEVEINIAPLQENEFTNCKSELKFFEAAAVGTWTIASPTSTFRAAIKDGETGRLARAHEWDDALNEAVDLASCSDKYSEHCEAASESAYGNYGWNKLTQKIVDATLPELNP